MWSWVQQRGKKAAEQLEIQLKSLSAKEAIEPEVLEPMVAKMILVMAVDGVMVPMRSQVGTAQGKTRWLEVKVGVLARLGHHLTRTGKKVTRLNHRRLVAVLGNTKALAPRLQLEALRQGLANAPLVVWISDGGKGFWNLYRQYFATYGVAAILDFYHAAGHLWRAAAAWLDGRTSQAIMVF